MLNLLLKSHEKPVGDGHEAVGDSNPWTLALVQQKAVLQYDQRHEIGTGLQNKGIESIIRVLVNSFFSHARTHKPWPQNQASGHPCGFRTGFHRG